MTEKTAGQGDKPQKQASPAPEPKKTESKNPEPGKTTAEKDSRQAKSASSTKTSQKPPQKTDRRLWRWLLLLILIGVLTVAGLFAWQWYQQRYVATGAEDKLVTAAPSPISSPDVPLDNPIANLEQALAEERQAREQLETSIQQVLADLSLGINSNAERLRQLSTTTREDWLLAEAEYLLRLANQRLLTERQGKNALALMESADSILRDIGDTALFPVRAALAKDITNLRLAGDVDREGIYLQLNALAGAVTQLPLLTSPGSSLLEEEEAEQEETYQEGSEQKDGGPESSIDDDVLPEDTRWYHRLEQNALRAIKNLSGLIRVRRLRDPMEPLLLPTEEIQLRQELRLSLQQAQLALLREEQMIYEISLTRVEEGLQDYFELNAQTQQVLTQVDSLRAQQIVQPLPSAAASLRALQDYINLWHSRQADPNKQSLGKESPDREAPDREAREKSQ